MTCPHCEALKERVAWLEGELGMAQAADTVETLARSLHIRPGAAKTLACLYAARGRMVTMGLLLDATADPARDDDRHPKILAVLICNMRGALGPDAIITAWGRGYSLSSAGLARIAAILKPEPAA